MKKIFAFAGLAALVLLSCQKEADNTVTTNAEVRTYSVVINPVTKTTIADGDDAAHKDLNWSAGDKIAFKFTDDSVVEAEVALDGSNAKVTVPVPDGESISDAWYPVNKIESVPTKPTKVLEYQTYGKVDIPLVMSSISGGTITFSEVTSEWAIVRVPVKAGSNGAARQLVFVKFKNNNGSAPVQNIQINTSEILSGSTIYYDFVVPAVESTSEIIFRDTNGLEYRRKASGATTFASHTVYTFPLIDDVDDTGRYTWIFKGEEGPDGNLLSQNAPFTYWFRPQADRFATINRGADYWTQTAWVQDAGNFKYRFGFAPTLNDSNQGKSSSEWGTIAESKTTINDTPNQVMRFPVHVGNYPIFAVKITKLGNLGNSRSFKLDVNSILAENQTGNEFIGRSMPVKYWDSTTSKTTLEETDTYGIYYFDLSSSSITFKYGDGSSRTQLPNSRTLHFTTWQIQIPDVKFDVAQDPLPTCNIYWAGFFNSRSELEAFAAAN